MILYLVLVELWWKVAAASVAILLLIGGLWVSMTGDKSGMNELIRVVAHQSRMYILPDSTKVWMNPGSSIQYAKDFNEDRRVWLEGNSLFEVYKHEGSTFQVYIDKAFIEVKGTCFLVKQDDITHNEITLFHGKIEFNVESTGQKVIMQPLQKVTYNVENAQTQIEQIANIKWENGKYNFKDIPLVQLIQTVNQMYKTNIVLKRRLGEESSFSGSIRYDETLDDVLEKICFSLNLTKDTHNEQIIIR